MNLTLKTPPASEPITIAEARDFLKVDFIDVPTDTYITSLIIAAREYCEDYQKRAYITQVWEMALQCFPCYLIEIPKGNLQTIDSITYKDSAGISTTLAINTDYVYSTRGMLGRIVPAYGVSWPSFTPYPLDAVVITFTCGYGEASDIPQKSILAMKLLISHWYENRVPIDAAKTNVKEVEFTLSALLSMDKILNL